MSHRAALVTGASRGIGRAIALALAAKGLSLYLAADGTEGELVDTAAACRTAGAPDAQCAIADLATPGEAERMVQTALGTTGRIDVLVSNAGIRSRKPFGSFTRADFAAVVEVNLAAA